jgi:hypothetical protein
MQCSLHDQVTYSTADVLRTMRDKFTVTHVAYIYAHVVPMECASSANTRTELAAEMVLVHVTLFGTAAVCLVSRSTHTAASAGQSARVPVPKGRRQANGQRSTAKVPWSGQEA